MARGEAIVDTENGPSKVCRGCRALKPLGDYTKHGACAGGVRSRCKSCMADEQRAYLKKMGPRQLKNRWLKANYGITVDDYDAMLEKQGGVCAICGGTETSCHGKDGKGVRALAVDHDHATGVVRKLLCAKCNKALGLLGDCPDRLRAAAAYIEYARV